MFVYKAVSRSRTDLLSWNDNVLAVTPKPRVDVARSLNVPFTTTLLGNSHSSYKNCLNRALTTGVALTAHPFVIYY